MYFTPLGKNNNNSICIAPYKSEYTETLKGTAAVQVWRGQTERQTRRPTQKNTIPTSLLRSVILWVKWVS